MLAEDTNVTVTQWPPKYPEVPDFKGARARQRFNAETLFNGQTQFALLVREVRLQGRKADDVIFGSDPHETYAERAAVLTTGIKDTWDEVEGYGDAEVEETQKQIDKFAEQDERRYKAYLDTTPGFDPDGKPLPPPMPRP